MNSLVRQDPWSLVPRLQDEINRLFGNQNDSSFCDRNMGTGRGRS